MESPNNPSDLLETAREAQHIQNKVSFVQNVVISLLFLVMSVGMLYYFTQKVDDEPLLIYVLISAFFIVPVLVIVQSYRITKKKLGPSTAATPFSGADMAKTVTKQQYERAQVPASSTITGWLGALDRTDLKGLSGAVGLKETINSAENTLLVIDNKIVAVSLTQEDFNLLGGSGPLNTVAQLSAAGDTAIDQKQSVAMLNYKKWPDLIDHIKAQDIQSFLELHYNFMLEPSKISKIEARMTFINPGVYIHLADGTILKYNTMLKDRIAAFTDSVRQIGIIVS